VHTARAEFRYPKVCWNIESTFSRCLTPGHFKLVQRPRARVVANKPAPKKPNRHARPHRPGAVSLRCRRPDAAAAGELLDGEGQGARRLRPPGHNRKGMPRDAWLLLRRRMLCHRPVLLLLPAARVQAEALPPPPGPHLLPERQLAGPVRQAAARHLPSRAVRPAAAATGAAAAAVREDNQDRAHRPELPPRRRVRRHLRWHHEPLLRQVLPGRRADRGEPEQGRPFRPAADLPHVQKRVFFAPFYTKTIFLPRQARDKRRKS
jgi:hypothetical protein